MEASSRLRAAQPGERIIAQARQEDRQRLGRIAKVRDAAIVEAHLLPAGSVCGQDGELVNFVLEKRA